MKLTSSNFAAAIGLSPYKSRQKLWRELTGRAEPEDLSNNPNVQRGIENEHRAVGMVAAVTGLIFEDTGANQRHYELLAGESTGKPVMLGTTPDGRCDSIGLEVKCPNSLSDEVPAHYMPQLQGQMLIAGFDEVIFGQWTEENLHRVWRVEKSEDYLLQMVEGLHDFFTYWRTDEQPKRRKKPVLPTVKTERIY